VAKLGRRAAAKRTQQSVEQRDVALPHWREL